MTSSTDAARKQMSLAQSKVLNTNYISSNDQARIEEQEQADAEPSARDTPRVMAYPPGWVPPTVLTLTSEIVSLLALVLYFAMIATSATAIPNDFPDTPSSDFKAFCLASASMFWGSLVLNVMAWINAPSREQRAPLSCVLTINLISALTHTILSRGWAPVTMNMYGQKVHSARWAEWTACVFLLMFLLTSFDLDTNDTARVKGAVMATFAQTVSVLVGLLACFMTNPILFWMCLVVSCTLFLQLYWMAYQNWSEGSEAMRRHSVAEKSGHETPEERLGYERTIQRVLLSQACMFGWTLFVVTFFLGTARLITPEQEATTMNVVDIISKAMYNVMLGRAHTVARDPLSIARVVFSMSDTMTDEVPVRRARHPGLKAGPNTRASNEQFTYESDVMSHSSMSQSVDMRSSAGSAPSTANMNQSGSFDQQRKAASKGGPERKKVSLAALKQPKGNAPGRSLGDHRVRAHASPLMKPLSEAHAHAHAGSRLGADVAEWMGMIPGLDKYTASVVEQGYVELSDLADADDDDLTQICATAGMLKPLAKKFTKRAKEISQKKP